MGRWGLRVAWTLGFFVCAVDVLAFGQGIGSVALGLPLLAMGRKKNPRQAGVALLVVSITISVIVGNNLLARSRAEHVVEAVDRYAADHGTYPKTLESLVPDYLPKVPRAKYMLSTFGEFQYWEHKERHTLMYYVLPPFGRRLHDFEEKRWLYLD